jgi:uncharacterized protein YjbJ (UPF0337 family)
MVNQQTLQGNWNEIKGKLRSKWGALTNDDVQNFNGNVDQLVGLIQRKTGEARNSIETYLEELTSNGNSVTSSMGKSVSQAAETVRGYATQAAERMPESMRQAQDQLRERYGQAEHMVREKPVESMAVCFGAGVFVGVLMGIMMRSR